MTQSCDLSDFQGDDEVLLCPLSDYRTAAAVSRELRGKDGWAKLIRGRFVGAYLMNRCEIPGHQFDYQVVDLKRVLTVPLGLVRQVAAKEGRRVRLLPPYREHLAQAFARQFMRVGLPEDLPRQYPYA